MFGTPHGKVVDMRDVPEHHREYTRGLLYLLPNCQFNQKVHVVRHTAVDDISAGFVDLDVEPTNNLSS